MLKWHSHEHFSKQGRLRQHSQKSYNLIRPNSLRPTYIQFLCLLILAPGFILFTPLLLLQPSPHANSLRSHSILRINQDRLRERVAKASHRFKRTRIDPSVPSINLHKHAAAVALSWAMSKKRVVALSIVNDEFRINFDDTLQRRNIESLSEDFTLLPSESDNANQTSHIIHMSKSVLHDSSSNNDANCIAMANWQTSSFPTCNSLHEMNIFSSSATMSYFDPRPQRRGGLRYNHLPKEVGTDGILMPISETYAVKLLGRGWFRNAWELGSTIGMGEDMVIKTLRLERDFLPEYYELHRRDAVAMERLTSSPYVINIFGHCGHSVVTERAFSEKGIDNLYRLSTRLKGVDTPYVLKTKLQIAAMTSLGLSHVHSVAVDDVKRHKTIPPATIAHYDINPRNIIMTPSGKPKLNDFNVAEFLTWDSKTNTQQKCGFDSRLHEPWWRAPEEMIVHGNNTADDTVEVYPKKKLSEKVDIYSLGNALFVLLTGLEPRGKEHKMQRFKSVSNSVARGDYPLLPVVYSNSTDPAVVAMRRAIKLCWEPDPNIRPTALAIAQNLFAVLDEIRKSVT